MTAPDPLARALLPVLLHKLGNATQLLTGLNAMLHLDGGEELFAQRTHDLARCSTTVDELGWALAVIGTGAGASLLLDRREPRGLEIMMPLARDASRRGEGAAIAARERLPRLAPGALTGWELPWGLASLLLAASADSGEETLSWTLEHQDGGGWRFEVAGGEELAARTSDVVKLLPGAEWSHQGGLVALHLPEGWLNAPGEDQPG